MSRSLYWIRNDHRLHDNAALSAYCQSSEGLIVWSMTPSLLRAKSLRKQFYGESLNVFLRALREKQQKVLCFEQPIEVLLQDLLPALKIRRLIFSREVGTEEEQSESKVVSLASKLGVEVVSFYQDTLLEREDYRELLLDFPKIFTDFRKKVEQNLRVPEPVPVPHTWPLPIESVNKTCENLFPKSLPYAVPARPGEVEGLQRLKSYFWDLDRARTYKETRNGMLDWNDSTKFSLWLASGSLSARQIYRELCEYENKVVKNESTYWIFFELLWRDYFKFYMQKQGASLFYRKSMESRKDPEAQDLFLKWCEGKTGDDFIDANMRELQQTGWMSNRGRQNVASFLAKKWQLPWQWGAEWFEKNLLDYDVASNWGNWSYFSGVGSDPRDRAFNTLTQAKYYDPDGAYRKRWLS